MFILIIELNSIFYQSYLMITFHLCYKEHEWFNLPCLNPLRKLFKPYPVPSMVISDTMNTSPMYIMKNRQIYNWPDN
jgi:hypothetical protein